ncbi:MAG: hypothetical protein D6703_04360 [Zetaproteobacteria bacterium]|nr:MAG: hypothetical protein D6703_04360 [Zetaproteobacteria bacterium]
MLAARVQAIILEAMPKRLLLLIVTPFMMLAIAYMTWPYWAAWVMSHALEQRGLQVRQLVLARPTLSGLAMHDIDIQLADMRFTAHNVSLVWSLNSLLEAKLEALLAEQLVIGLPGPDASAPGPFLVPEPSLLKRLPFRRAEVRTLQVNLPNGRQLRGKAELAHHRLYLDLQEHEQHLVMSTDASGTVRARWGIADAQAIDLSAQWSAAAGQGHLHASCDIDFDILNELLKRWGYPLDLQLSGNGQVTLDMHLPIRAERKEDWLRASTGLVQTDLDVQALRHTVASSLAGTFSWNRGQGAWTWKRPARVRLGQTGQALSADITGAAIQADWRTNPIISLPAGMALNVQHLALGGLSIPQFEIRLNKASELTFSDHWLLKTNLAAVIDIPKAMLNHAHLTSCTSQLLVESEGEQVLGGQLHVQSCRIRHAGHALALSDLASSWRLSGHTLNGSWRLGKVNGQRIPARGEWSFHADRNELKVAYVLPSTAVSDLGSIVDAWLSNHGLRLADGTMQANGEIHRRDDQWMAQGRLKTHHLRGSFRKRAFKEVSATLSWHMQKTSMRLSVHQIRAGLLPGPVPIKNLTCRLELDSKEGLLQRLDIPKCQFSSLGGNIYAKDVKVDRQQPHNPFIVHIEGIDVARLVALEQQQGLKASGKLDGHLPLDWRADGLYLVQGTLQARSPGGIIRYEGTPATRRMGEKNLGVRTALDVLRDFRYQQMRIRADYTPDGSLRLKVHLYGHNPSYAQGRPIELNLNVQENLPALLRSLQTGGQIEHEVQRRLGGE